MRLLPCLLWLFLPFAGFAQDANSLLWEISGNGLEKPSYLYGTMHVSKKIAFLLDDVFYEALDQSEVVALESDPATWLENDTDNSRIGHGFTTKGFYTEAFTLQSPGKKDLAGFLATDDDLVNNILYRTTEYAQDFEEETYLDMFIYQAGSKFGKPILALEDLEESQALVGRASMNAMKRKPDDWLQKKMEGNDLMSLMQDAYRERNIALLDSIDRAVYTDHYLNNMLYIRNEIMAERLDSAIREARVFAGIGAAHLPGEKGVIALLEKQGYKVKPLVSEATEHGKGLKEKIVSSFRPPSLSPQGPRDESFTIGLPHKLYPVAEGQHTTYISPDLTNGSYFMVHRIPMFSYLNPKSGYTIEDIEGMLFENIPGKILGKEKIRKQGFQGLDIQNRLKNGDYQRYQVFTTPLEILIFKMGGQGDYVSRYGDAIFNSLKFRPVQKGMQPLVPAFRDYAVDFPVFHSFPNQDRKGNRLLEGFDPANTNYYFLKQATLNDFDFIERDSFELKQIQQQFYRRHNLKAEFQARDGMALTSSAPYGDKRIYLKSQLRRGDYFLLGIITGEEQAAEAYFNSFKLLEPTYGEAFEQIRDTALFFTTVSPVPPNKFVETSRGHYKSRKEEKAYHPFTKKSIYQHPNNEAIVVTLNKSHDFMTFPSIDSVWAIRKKQYAADTFTLSEASDTSRGGVHELRLVLTDTASSRGILIKNIVKGGLLYEVKAALDTLHRPSSFVTAFIDNFQPLDTLIGRDLMEDKTGDFFKALRENDSIVMKGYRYLLFDERHADSLMHYVANYDFSGDKEHIQSHLLKELGRMDLPEVHVFLRSFYARSYNNSNAQTRILQAAAKPGAVSTSLQLLDLLEKDVPLASNPYEIERIFSPYYDSLPMARDLFPKLLPYSSIAEYKEPIIGLLATLLANGHIKPKRYKKYLGTMLSDANMQLKRQLGVENQSRMQKGNFAKNARQQRKLLEDYSMILFPFRQDRAIRPFFERLFEVGDPEIRTTYMALLASEDINIPNGIIDSLAADINSRNLLYKKLEAVGKVTLYPKGHLSQQALAEAALFEGERFDRNSDIVKYAGEEELVYDGERYSGYYFMHKNELDFNKNYKMYMLVFAKDQLSTIPVYRNKGIRMSDTDTEEEMRRYVREEFALKDHPRAVVFETTEKGIYGYGF